MYVYRNIAWKPVSFDDENYQRTLCIEELEADEYTLLECIPFALWTCEEDVIYNVRKDSSFFNKISDVRIRELLEELVINDKLEKRYVKTDLEESQACENCDNFSITTDEVPKIRKEL
jgi:hypothetical protein